MAEKFEGVKGMKSYDQMRAIVERGHTLLLSTPEGSIPVNLVKSLPSPVQLAAGDAERTAEVKSSLEQQVADAQAQLAELEANEKAKAEAEKKSAAGSKKEEEEPKP